MFYLFTEQHASTDLDHRKNLSLKDVIMESPTDSTETSSNDKYLLWPKSVEACCSVNKWNVVVFRRIFSWFCYVGLFSPGTNANLS
jgi:hypothetical protein